MTDDRDSRRQRVERATQTLLALHQHVTSTARGVMDQLASAYPDESRLMATALADQTIGGLLEDLLDKDEWTVDDFAAMAAACLLLGSASDGEGNDADQQ